VYNTLKQVDQLGDYVTKTFFDCDGYANLNGGKFNLYGKSRLPFDTKAEIYIHKDFEIFYRVQVIRYDVPFDGDLFDFVVGSFYGKRNIYKNNLLD
jgi:hypothetical protein